MSRMIGDPEAVSNQGGHSGLGPHLPWEAERFRPLGQQLQELVPLCRGQAGGCSWGWLVTQTFFPSLWAPLEPLAHRPLGYPQGIGDLMLLPTLLMKFPGPQAATLPPIGSLARQGLFHEAETTTSDKFVPLVLCAGISKKGRYGPDAGISFKS